jgi:hypothetical protein
MANSGICVISTSQGLGLTAKNSGCGGESSRESSMRTSQSLHELHPGLRTVSMNWKISEVSAN